jgi:putative Mg2+ transporter-C (MgtC) family protein
MGSTLFTLFSKVIGSPGSPDRIASNIVTGVGFVGAGVIFKDTSTGINGVTTAATIWITAALGIGVGGGYEYLCLILSIILVLILYAFIAIEEWIGKLNSAHTYKIVCQYHEQVLEQFEALLKQHRIVIKKGTQSRNNNIITTVWETEGSKKNHKQFINHMLNDSSVQQFEF